MRQIAENPTVVPQLARRALEICHFDPDALEDKGARTCGDLHGVRCLGPAECRAALYSDAFTLRAALKAGASRGEHR